MDILWKSVPPRPWSLSSFCLPPRVEVLLRFTHFSHLGLHKGGVLQVFTLPPFISSNFPAGHWLLAKCSQSLFSFLQHGAKWPIHLIFSTSPVRALPFLSLLLIVCCSLYFFCCSLYFSWNLISPPAQSSSWMSFSMFPMSIENRRMRLYAWIGLPT